MSSLSPVLSVVGPVAQASPAAAVATEQKVPSRVVEPASQVAEAPAESGHLTVKAAAEQIETYLRHVNTNLEFRVDTAAGQVVVSVRERATGKLIRQIPSEEALRLAERLAVQGKTALVDQET